MYSENTRPGHHPSPQPDASCHLCAHNGPPLHYGPGHSSGPCLGTEADLPQLGRGRDAGTIPQDVGWAQGQERNRASVPPSLQRWQGFTGPKPCTVPGDCSPSYPWELSSSRWDWPWDPRLGYCTSVREDRGEGGCVRRCCYSEAHPFSVKYALPLPPAQFRGRHYHREARYVEEHYWGSVSEHYQRDGHVQVHRWDKQDMHGFNGQCEQKHTSFQGHNEHKYHHLDMSRQSSVTEKDSTSVQRAFFSTEVPKSKIKTSRQPGAPCLLVNGAQRREQGPGQAERMEAGSGVQSQRKSQGAIREQIKQVVTNLEEVLGGLKQVHLEMREVVQQIDHLTSNIDLGEEEGPGRQSFPPVTHSRGARGGVVALSQCAKTNGELGPPHRDPAHRLLKSQTNPMSPVHNRSFTQSSRVASLSPGKEAPQDRCDVTRDRCAVNGDCLQSRPPRVKVKETKKQRGRGDPTSRSRSQEPPTPPGSGTGSTKTQRPPPYPQNGQVKTMHKGSDQPANALRTTPPYPGKGRQLSSTVV